MLSGPYKCEMIIIKFRLPPPTKVGPYCYSIVIVQENVVTSQPGRPDDTTIPMGITATSPAATDAAPPSYSEAINHGSNPKPDETTALNSGDKMGYTPGNNENICFLPKRC